MRPVLLTLPPWMGGGSIYAYGVMLGLSFFVGWYLTLWAAQKAKLDRNRVMLAMTAVILGGLAGARVLFFVSNPQRWHGLGSLFDLEHGGLVLYGGLLGGIVSGVLALRALKLDFWRFADLVAPQLALGVAVARLGCFFYGCDFGQRTAGPWGVRFPHWDGGLIPGVGAQCASNADCPALSHCEPISSTCLTHGAPAWSLHQRLGEIGVDAVMSAPVHPVQVYASLNGALLFGVLLLARRYWQRAHGQLILFFLGWYAAARFMLERLREDPQRGAVWETSSAAWSWILVEGRRALPDGAGVETFYALTTSQFISLLILMAVATLGTVAWRRYHGQSKAPGLLGAPIQRAEPSDDAVQG